jgi:hypothetical protein
MDIKVFNEFMKKEDANSLIDYIDDNLNKFESHQDGKYRILLFGKDEYFESSINLSGIDEVKDLVIEYFNKVINKIKYEYKYHDDLYISSFWLAKQIDGSHLGLHNDNDLGKNTHFKYSCGIYLNDILKDGELHFPNLKYIYKPKCGDLVSWPSQNTNYDHEVNKISSDRYAMLLWLTHDKNYALKY